MSAFAVMTAAGNAMLPVPRTTLPTVLKSQYATAPANRMFE